MSSAGQQLVAGRIPGERIATDEKTADSATFTTTRTLLQSIVAPLVAGRTYRVTADSHLASTVDGDLGLARLWRNAINDIEMQAANVTIGSNSVFGWPVRMEAEFTAVTTGDVTFVLSGERTSGTGDLQLEAQGNRPSYLYVDYIRG